MGNNSQLLGMQNRTRLTPLFRLLTSDYYSYSCVFEPENVKLLNFEDSPSEVQAIGMLKLPHLEKPRINLELTDDVSFLDIAPWTLLVPTVRFDLIKTFLQIGLTLNPANSFICNLLQTIIRQKKN